MIVLPLADSPIRCYQIHAYRLSIILNYPECLPWFYSNYIQVVGKTSHQEDLFNYSIDFHLATEEFHTAVPWLDFCPMSPNIFFEKLSCDVHDVLRYSIDEGHYLYTIVDEYYIPSRKAYQIEQKYYHDILIYGYDLANKLYLVSGFDQNMQYEKTSVPFELMEKAIHSAGAPITQIYKKNIKYELNMNLIKELLEDYMYSNNSSKRNMMNSNPLSDSHCYGMSTYDGFIEHLKGIQHNTSSKDIRIPHLLYEHKECMMLRIKYLTDLDRLKEPNEIISKYKMVRDHSLILRNLYLKMIITNNIGLVESLNSAVVKLKEIDMDISDKLLNNLVI
ncbi:BtrH N-terminal domain-containing protein [Paenibacillus polysaccharolyticus]|uniref:BtrH N-terminal domain-containing protein n=1 Tax=Paenibacillus polysaccharolyticus TaxID=582692 RepID=UPI00209DDB0E|nr:BtrH N-terminal domain-containing protein [Paenibacillus polysaccharolyticus]MCP1135451.1 BtrH N-terminal domain-containing protein [Paenibacillus polysaccharolyticus]